MIDPDLEGLQDPDACDHSAEEQVEKDMQKAIVGAIVKYDSTIRFASTCLKPSHFLDQAHKTIVDIALDHYKEHGTRPTKATVLREIGKRHEGDKAVLYYLGEAKGIYDYYEPEHDPGYIEAQILTFAKNSILHRSLRQFIENARKGEDAYPLIRDAFSRIDRLTACRSVRRAYSPSELTKLAPVKWAVEKHLTQGGFTCVYGPYGSCKTFYVLDMSLCICTGRSFLGRYAVEPGLVCYVTGEGASGINKRLTAWCLRHGIAPADLDGKFSLVPAQFDLLDPAQVQALADLARDHLGRMPDLFIFDTLTKMFGSGDSNAPKDMTTYVNNLIRLQEIGQAGGVPTGVLSIHHTGKDRSRGSMGATNLPGACDSMIETDGDAATKITIRCHKQKDGARFKDYELVANPVAVPQAIDPTGEGSLVLTRRTGSLPEINAACEGLARDLWKEFGPGGFTFTEGMQKQDYFKSKSAYSKRLQELVDAGYYAKDEDSYRATPEGAGLFTSIYRPALTVDGEFTEGRPGEEAA